MDLATREFVRRRAGHACEYCRLWQEHSELSHHVEHIVAKQHGGGDDSDNLALACHRCNLRKGPNLSGIDPQTGQVTRLFIRGAIDGMIILLSKAPGSRVLARSVASPFRFWILTMPGD